MLKDLKEKIKDKKLILFGELHGTKEIPDMISNFFSELAIEEDFNVCLEIPEEFQKQIINFMDIGDEKILEKIPFFAYTVNSDGRNSFEYINLIKNLRLLNKKYNREIKIFFVDSDSNTQENKEKNISENTIKILSNKKTFMVLGDIHASKNQFSLGRLNIIPAGSMLFNKLREKMFNVRIIPLKGNFYNFGIKEISSNMLNDLFNKNFDYIIKIDKVTVCSFQKKQ